MCVYIVETPDLVKGDCSTLIAIDTSPMDDIRVQLL